MTIQAPTDPALDIAVSATRQALIAAGYDVEDAVVGDPHIMGATSPDGVPISVVLNITQ